MTPLQAAAPQPPQLNPTTASSTASLIDVDTPSVHTVPSNFTSQEIKTETQAARIEREERAESARAEADLAKKKAGKGGRDKRVAGLLGWLRGYLERVGATVSGEGVGGAARAVALVNVVAVVGLSGWLGFRAWGLYDRGRLGWREVAGGLGVLGAVGAVEGVFVS